MLYVGGKRDKKKERKKRKIRNSVMSQEANITNQNSTYIDKIVVLI